MYLNYEESEYKNISQPPIPNEEFSDFASSPYFSGDISHFPFYQPEYSYTSDPLDSPPPEFFDEITYIDDVPNSCLYSSHLSVIEEDSHPLCISHTDPLQHVLDTLATLNDETTEMEHLIFLKKKYFQLSLLSHFPKSPFQTINNSNPSALSIPNHLLNPSFSGIVDTLLEKVNKLHIIIQEVNEHLGDLREVGVGEEEVHNVEEYVHSLGARLQFLRKLIYQVVSEREPVISLEVIDEAEEICECSEEKGMEG